MEELEAFVGRQEPTSFAAQGKPKGRRPCAKPKAGPKAKAKAKAKPFVGKMAMKSNKGKGRFARPKVGKAKGKPGKEAAEKGSQKTDTGPQGGDQKGKQRKKRSQLETHEPAPKRVVKARQGQGRLPQGSGQEATKTRRQKRKQPDVHVAEESVKAMGPEPPTVPVHYGPQVRPPAHVKTNNVYSSAYRKASPLGPEYARLAGRMATRLFSEKGVVDGLCGDFRSRRRVERS